METLLNNKVFEEMNFFGTNFCNDFTTLKRMNSTSDKKHLIIFVHGLGGSHLDLLAYKTILKLICTHQSYLMCSWNNDTFAGIEDQANVIMDEINVHMTSCDNFDRISFIAYSLGNMVARTVIESPDFEPYLNKLYTFMSLSGPHLGVLFNNNLYAMGTWLLKKLTKSKALSELELKDADNVKDTYIYRLSYQKSKNSYVNSTSIYFRLLQIQKHYFSRLFSRLHGTSQLTED
ncbi:MAG: hypothetical protein MHPSP_002148 [Paramarteilia canceri]